MAYLTQNAGVGRRTFRFYAVQNQHNHDRSIEFSKAIKDLMKLSFPNQEISLGSFKSNQSAIPEGTDVVQLYWKKPLNKAGYFTNNK